MRTARGEGRARRSAHDPARRPQRRADPWRCCSASDIGIALERDVVRRDRVQHPRSRLHRAQRHPDPRLPAGHRRHHRRRAVRGRRQHGGRPARTACSIRGCGGSPSPANPAGPAPTRNPNPNPTGSTTAQSGGRDEHPEAEGSEKVMASYRNPTRRAGDRGACDRDRGGARRVRLQRRDQRDHAAAAAGSSTAPHAGRGQRNPQRRRWRHGRRSTASIPTGGTSRSPGAWPTRCAPRWCATTDQPGNAGTQIVPGTRGAADRSARRPDLHVHDAPGREVRQRSSRSPPSDIKYTFDAADGPEGRTPAPATTS